jgi:hypothetical protein
MRPPFIILALAFAVAGAVAMGVAALFSEAMSVPANVFATDTLNPPTALSSTGVTSTALSWTATSDTYASGHRVLRGTVSGGPYTQVGQVTPRTTTAFTESPAAGTYYYVLRSYFQNWESVDSAQVAALVSAQTGFSSCSANAAVTTSSGDNDGFQTTPSNACTDGAGSAEDVNTGTGSPDTCASIKKDRHLFYNYGFTVPAGASIRGIEVRLDAWVDQLSTNPFTCVELSWDGGATWTAAKNTPDLVTSETTYSLGSTSDTWGRTWTVSDLSDANFRVQITNVAGFNGRDFFLDWVAVRVTYTP